MNQQQFDKLTNKYGIVSVTTRDNEFLVPLESVSTSEYHKDEDGDFIDVNPFIFADFTRLEVRDYNNIFVTLTTIQEGITELSLHNIETSSSATVKFKYFGSNDSRYSSLRALAKHFSHFEDVEFCYMALYTKREVENHIKNLEEI